MMHQIGLFEGTLLCIVGIIIGMSKSGIGAVSIISVSILAWMFGSRLSSGITLPMLIMADVIAVIHYKRNVLWSHVLKLLPWIIVGVVAAAVFGKYIDDKAFKKLMAVIILISVAALFWWEKYPLKKTPSHWLFSSSMGFATGFTSMIGNLAGGFSNVYFISMRVSKDHFIGSAAYMFFILNLFKMPFHIFMWNTISSETLLLNVILLPAIILGFYLGDAIVSKFDGEKYNKVILWLTLLSALVVLFDLR
jgi:uncharacterized protein